jgi:polyisoprenyl-teichoic acid--peptidoglycan teichoic acid transferase
MLLRALAGVLTVFVAVTAGVAGAGYLQIPIPKPPQPPIPGLGDGDVVPPEPDGPRTLLVLGSDRRAATAVDARGGVPHSDTIVLLRLDPDRNRIAVLSLPRDLAVHIPGLPGRRKINEAYDHGGPAKTLKTVKALFGGELEINGVIDVNFRGFQQAVNAVGGVYVDVDRDYTNPEGTGYASIDVKAGYQRLVGSDALAYVRYRHDDSDLFRNARQQEFLRQAGAQPAVDRLKSFGAATEFADELVRYFRFDESFGTRRSSAGMIKTALSLALHHAPVNQVALGGITESDNPTVDTRLFVSDQRVREAYDAFLTGKRNPKPTTAKPARAQRPQATGLEDAGRLGEDLAVVASSRLGSLPFYFPELRFSGSTYVAGTPRVYTDHDERGRRFRAYRLVIATGGIGEYYGVQGMTWRDPPLLASPDRVRVVGGRRLELFYDGSRLRLVAWRTAGAAYYVTNTLNRRLSNAQMLAIAGSLRRL